MLWFVLMMINEKTILNVSKQLAKTFKIVFLEKSLFKSLL